MFRFTIRDLLLMTVIVAISLGWWIDRSRVAGERDSAESSFHRRHREADVAEVNLRMLVTVLRERGWIIKIDSGSGLFTVVQPPSDERQP